MPFTWGQAGLTALIGFAGVFAILFILQRALTVIGKIVDRFARSEKKEG